MSVVTDPKPDVDASPDVDSSSAAEAVSPPLTGVELIDAALDGIDLSGPVDEHPGQLAAAVEVLQQVLRHPPEQ